jgi:hypothetical protein
VQGGNLIMKVEKMQEEENEKEKDQTKKEIKEVMTLEHN